MSIDGSQARHARIAWRCRRGMRELDLLLARFLAECLEGLETTDLERLERLLEEPDQDILAWITGARAPRDVDSQRIVNIIRSAIGDDAILDAGTTDE